MFEVVCMHQIKVKNDTWVRHHTSYAAPCRVLAERMAGKLNRAAWRSGQHEVMYLVQFPLCPHCGRYDSHYTIEEPIYVPTK